MFFFNLMYTYLALTTAVTTTPFCDTRLCLVLGVERCIPVVDICDGEKFCDNGTDENRSLFPNIDRCHQTTGTNNISEK